MAISDSQKIDLLYKKLFGVAKTDTSANKSPSNESIASPAFVRNDKMWFQSASIPGTAANVVGIVRPYLTTERIALAADTTTTPVSNVYPTWKSNLTDWIPPEFGSTYFVKVYAENGGNLDPTANTSLSDAGIGGVGEWNFDYQSGVLNFIGGTIPAVLTGSASQTKVLYLTGYRYVGVIGVPTDSINSNIASVALSVANLTTTTIAEGANLWFTNARVLSALVNADLSANSLTLAGQLYANGLIIRNISVTDGVLTGNVTSFVVTSNTVVADSVTSNIWNRLYTANVIETAGNLYFTNSRVVSALIAGNNITIEANGRISATSTAGTDTPSANILAVVDPRLTTANVIEVSSNLYFTNTRVYAALSDANVTIGNLVVRQDAIISGNLTVGSGALGTLFGLGNIFAKNITVDRITANIWSGLIAGNNITIEANGRISANATGAGTIVTAITPYLTTANVVESASNLYYTNARARAAINAGTGVIYDSVTGTVSIGQNVSTTANVTFGSITVLGNLYVLGNAVQFATNTLIINDTLIQLGVDNPSDALDIGFVGHYVDNGQRHSGLIRDHESKKYFLFDNYAVEPGNDIKVANANTEIHYSTLVAQTFEGNVLGTVSSLANHTTSNLAEGTNQYFTNSRVVASLTGGKGIVIEANGLITATGDALFVGNVIGIITSIATTANVVESASNLYYTDARVNTAVRPMLTTANVIESVSNLYYTDARVNTAVRPMLTTANVIETSANLYFTNARVIASLSEANVTIGNIVVRGDIVARGNITAINTIVANALIIRDTPISDEFLFGQVIRANVIAANTITTNVIFANSFVSTGTGTPTLSSATNINLSAGGAAGGAVVITSSALRFRSYNTTDRANITAAAGDVIFNTTFASLQYYNGNAWTNVGYDIDPFTLVTANVREWSSNLYFTNARVYAALSDANVTIGNLIIRQDIVARGNITALNTLTANALVIRDIPITDELLRGNITGSYVTTNDIVTNSITANIWNRLYTANVIETSGNLYYTDARVNTAVRPMLTTANVTELASNLYFTNSRVVSALIAGNNIVIEANGRISTTGTATYSNADAVTAVQQATSLLVDTVTDSSTLILFFNAATYRSAKFVYTVNTTTYSPGGPQYASGEILVMHNGSNTYATQYAMLTSTNDDLVVFQTDINSGNIRVLAQTTSATTVANIRLSGITYTSA